MQEMKNIILLVGIIYWYFISLHLIIEIKLTVKVDDGSSSIQCIISKEELANLKGTEPIQIPNDGVNVLLEVFFIII